MQRWVSEGYPTSEAKGADGSVTPSPASAEEHFHYDTFEVGGWFDCLPLRGFSEVVEESDEWRVTRNGAGASFKYWKHKYGTPEHVDFRMTSREVWERDYRSHVLELDRERVDVKSTREALQRRRTE
jgi:hypothetical protein